MPAAKTKPEAPEKDDRGVSDPVSNPPPSNVVRSSAERIAVGRVVRYLPPGAERAPLAAIVTEVTSDGPTLTVFLPRGGTNIVTGVPHHGDAKPGGKPVGTWRWYYEG